MPSFSASFFIHFAADFSYFASVLFFSIHSLHALIICFFFSFALALALTLYLGLFISLGLRSAITSKMNSPLSFDRYCRHRCFTVLFFLFFPSNTMINIINLFMLYLRSHCMCDAIMALKVKLDIAILFRFIYYKVLLYILFGSVLVAAAVSSVFVILTLFATPLPLMRHSSRLDTH